MTAAPCHLVAIVSFLWMIRHGRSGLTVIALRVLSLLLLVVSVLTGVLLPALAP